MDVVLYQPEIPQNTGSIARTCAATSTPLRLIGKLGFEITEKRVRRAGLDYWPHVQISTFSTWEEYLEQIGPRRLWFCSRFAERLYYTADFSDNDAIVFGNETAGLPKEFFSRYPSEQFLRIPIPCPGVRSLNLSNAVSVVLYEARRQLKLDQVLQAPERAAPEPEPGESLPELPIL